MMTEALQTVTNAFSDVERSCIAAHLENEGKSSPRTMELANCVLTQMFKFLGGKGLLAITKRDILAFLDRINSRLADSSKGVYRSHVKSFFAFATDYLEMENVDFKNPVPSREFYSFSRAPIEDEDGGRLLTIDQIKAILAATERTNKRDYIYALLIVHTGMRPAEDLTIRIENVHVKERFLRTGYEKICQKSSKHTKRPLEFCFSPEVAAVLADYMLYLNRCDGWLFPSARLPGDHMGIDWYNSISAKYSKMVGFDFTWGDLRHTLITLRKMKFDGVDGRMKILDWESEILMNHVPKTMETKAYLEKPIEFKRKIFDMYYIYKGLI